MFQKSGVRIIDSWDRDGNERFHPEPLTDHVYPPYPTWLEHYAWRKPVFVSLRPNNLPLSCIRHNSSDLSV